MPENVSLNSPPGAPGSPRAGSQAAVLFLVGSVAVVGGGGLYLRSKAVAVVAPPPIAFKALGRPMEGFEPLLVCDLDGDGMSDVIRLSVPQPLTWLSRGDGTFDTVDFPFFGPKEMPLVPARLDPDQQCDFVMTGDPVRTTLMRGWRYVWPIDAARVDPNALPARYGAPDGGTRVLQRQQPVFAGLAWRDPPIQGAESGWSLLSGDFDGDQYADLFERPVAEIPPATEDPLAELGGDLGWPRFYAPTRGYFPDADKARAAEDLPPEATPIARIRYNITDEHPRLVPLAHGQAFHAGRVSVVVGDFNGDKRTDILRQPRGAWLAKGDLPLVYFGEPGGFRVERVRAVNSPKQLPKVDLELDGDQVVLAVADFDGDGKQDLLWKREHGGDKELPKITVWLSRGDGSFTVVVPTGVDPSWAAPSVRLYPADFDGDGRFGLAVQNTALQAMQPYDQPDRPAAPAR